VSVDALKQVLPHARRVDDNPPVSPGLQLLLVAIAWLTPQGSDSTKPITYRDIANATYQGERTIGRLILEGLSRRALEITWAKPGYGARYRVNRGDWHIPADPGELEETLAKLADVGRQEQLANMADAPANMADAPANMADAPAKMAGSTGQNGHPLKKKEIKKEEESAAVFAAHNPELFGRLREKGMIE
jgi:ribosomal protein L12E/L44/L45/RPP1/RPP2